jgi:hypothetical protein
MLDQFLQRPSRHYLSALLSGARAKVDDVVSLTDGLFIVLHPTMLLPWSFKRCSVPSNCALSRGADQ